jgi:hypothetical protein
MTLDNSVSQPSYAMLYLFSRLSRSTTDETVRMMTDRETCRSRGFGFVEMPDGQAAPRSPDGKTTAALPQHVTLARRRVWDRTPAH